MDMRQRIADLAGDMLRALVKRHVIPEAAAPEHDAVIHIVLQHLADLFAVEVGAQENSKAYFIEIIRNDISVQLSQEAEKAVLLIDVDQL